MKKPIVLLLLIVFVCSGVAIDIKFKSNDENLLRKAEKHSYGAFYETLEDVANDKPLKGVKMVDGSYSQPLFSGQRFKLKLDNGEVEKEKPKNFPAPLFMYRRHNLYADYIVGRDIEVSQYLLRVIGKRAYKVLIIGKLNLYALYGDEGSLFFAEGWYGELQKFKEKRLKEYLEQYDLLQQYLDDKPKREFDDSVSGYHYKIIDWRMKYVKLLNEKMK